jgi:hemerythrin-like domain-containing protein
LRWFLSDGLIRASPSPNLVKAGSDLKADHLIVRRLEGVLRVLAARVARREKVPPGDLAEAISLMTEFVDLYHHAKEESGLFPIVQKLGRGEQKTIYGFLVEHEFGRRAANRVSQEYQRWLKQDEASFEPLSRFILTYADFIRTHTAKEDQWFKEVDGNLLSDVQQHEVLRRFDEVARGDSAGRLDFKRRVNLLANRYTGRQPRQP